MYRARTRIASTTPSDPVALKVLRPYEGPLSPPIMSANGASLWATTLLHARSPSLLVSTSRCTCYQTLLNKRQQIAEAIKKSDAALADVKRADHGSQQGDDSRRDDLDIEVRQDKCYCLKKHKVGAMH